MSDRRAAGGLRLVRLFGIDLVVDTSWVVIAALVTWAIQVEVGSSHAGTGAELWFIAFGAALAFFGSVLVHELAHSVVAQRRGAHVLRIRLFIFGGVSEIGSELERPGDEFAVTIVGPVSSALLGLVFLGGAWLLPSGPIASAISLLGIVNVALAVFNLLPGFPLDGGRLLRSVIWRFSGDHARATRIAVWSGQALGVGIMVLGALVLALARQPGGLWYLAIGWFLFRAAADALVQSVLHGGMAQAPVAELTLPPVEVEAGTDLGAAAQLFSEAPVALVRRAGRVVGTVDMGRVELVPIEHWTQTAVETVMVPVQPEDLVPHDASLADVVRALGRRRRLIVVDDGRALGILTRKGVEERVRVTRGRRRSGVDPTAA